MARTHLIDAILSTLWYFELRQIIVVIYSMHCGRGAKYKFNDKHNKCFVENADAAIAIHPIEIPHFMTPPEVLLLIIIFAFAFVFAHAQFTCGTFLYATRTIRNGWKFDETPKHTHTKLFDEN